MWILVALQSEGVIQLMDWYSGTPTKQWLEWRLSLDCEFKSRVELGGSILDILGDVEYCQRRVDMLTPTLEATRLQAGQLAKCLAGFQTVIDEMMVE